MDSSTTAWHDLVIGILSAVVSFLVGHKRGSKTRL